MSVSIITACRNEAAGIRATADSVAAQTARELEWIVVDGGSTDGTLAILEEYRPLAARILSGPDGGVYDAMNKGAALARGEWLLFLNGGDALAGPEVVARVLPELGERGDHVVVGAHLSVWPDGRPPRRKPPPAAPDRHHFYRRTINHQSAFIGRRVFERFGPYDLSFRLLADHDFFARAALGGTRFRCIPEVVARYDMTGVSARLKHDGSMTEELRRIRGRYPRTYRLRRICSDLCVASRELLLPRASRARLP